PAAPRTRRARRADPLSALAPSGLGLARAAAGPCRPGVRSLRAGLAPPRVRAREQGGGRRGARRGGGSRGRDPARAEAVAAVPPRVLRDVFPRSGRLPARGGGEPRLATLTRT